MDAPQFMRRVANGRDMYDIRDELRAELTRKIFTSPIFFIRNFLQTVDKESEIVLQDPWIGQTILDLCCESQRKRRMAQQVIEIKPRQVGWTQHNIARGFWASMRPNNRTLVLVNDEDIAADFMQRVSVFYNNLPKWMRPMKRIDNPKMLNFDNPRAELRAEAPGLASQFLCTVPSGIRGMSPRYFIWSEAAFTKDWESVVDGVFNSMGASAAFAMILDSTPNGEDDFYYPKCMEAIERNPKWVSTWERKGVPTRQQIIDGILGEPDRPKDGFVPAFMPWFWHENYTTEDENPLGQMPSLDNEQIKWITQTTGKIERYGAEEELDLIARYAVSVYRLAWRRWKIDNHTAGNDWYERLLTFRQEHAADYRSCFIKIGRSTFDTRGMEVLGRQVMAPPIRGCLRRHPEKGLYVDQTFHSDWMELRVWATPQRDEEYVIGVDGANNWESNDADAWVAQVLRRRDRKQVATMKMKTPPNVVREHLAMLYEFYNRAYLGIEMEGAAIAVARDLYGMGVTHQYMYKRMDTDPYVEPTKYIGWETNSKTRPTMQGLLVELVGMRNELDMPEPGLILRDPETYSEMSSCTRNDSGLIANHGGGHDDHVIALMIALAINEDVWDRPRPKPKDKSLPPENPLLKPYLGTRGGGHNSPSYDTL